MKTNKLNIPVIINKIYYINNSIDHFKFDNKYQLYRRIIRSDPFTFTLTGIHLCKY